jgi:membrane protein insertase Oxa1/YidC/SpoIIIJ
MRYHFPSKWTYWQEPLTFQFALVRKRTSGLGIYSVVEHLLSVQQACERKKREKKRTERKEKEKSKKKE